MSPLILRLDTAGQPVKWVPWQVAICLYSRDMIAWTAGESVFSFRGGTNRVTGERSTVTVNSIAPYGQFFVDTNVTVSDNIIL